MMSSAHHASPATSPAAPHFNQTPVSAQDPYSSMKQTEQQKQDSCSKSDSQQQQQNSKTTTTSDNLSPDMHVSTSHTKNRLKRIKAKYDRNFLMSYAKLRELRQLSKSNRSKNACAGGNHKARKLSTTATCNETQGNAGVKVQGHSQEIVMSHEGNKQQTEIAAVAAASGQTEVLDTSNHKNNNHIPPPVTPETPDVTSSTTLHNEARVAHIAETLGIPKGK